MSLFIKICFWSFAGHKELWRCQEEMTLKKVLAHEGLG